MEDAMLDMTDLMRAELGPGAGALLLFCLLIGAVVYFLPTIIAFSREHRNAVKICLVNLLLGWTVLGWLVVLIWALTNNLAEGNRIIKGQRLGGFWIRTLAAVIDYAFFTVLLSTPVVVIYFIKLLAGLSEHRHFIGGGPGDWSIWEIVSYLVIAIATVWLWLRFSATPGKMVTRLKVVDAQTGNRLTLVQAVIRYASYLVSFIPFALGFIWAGIDKHKQAWHDKLAGTVVIQEQPAAKSKSHRKRKDKMAPRI